MHVELKPKIADILQAQVAEGFFGTIGDAVTAAIVGIGPGHDGDLSWAKPCVDAGLTSLERGHGVPHDMIRADIRVRFRTSS